MINIKNDNISILLIEILFSVIFLIVNFVFKVKSADINNIIVLSLLVVAYIFYHMKKENQRNKKQLILLTIIVIGLSYIVSYIISFRFGFLSANNLHALYNIFSLSVFICAKELSRFILIKKAEHNKVNIIINIILFIIIDISFMNSYYSLSGKKEIITYLMIIVFPAISSNVLLYYLSEKQGYSLAIIYEVITRIPAILLPFYPNLGIYLTSVLKIIVPNINKFAKLSRNCEYG